MSTVDIYNSPVVAPPDGVTSNFDRGWSSVQMTTIIVFGVTYFLATVSLVLRYITSAVIVKQWELDVAWGAALGYFVSVSFCMTYGWGQHAWDITIAEATQYYNYLLPTTLTYMWSPTLTKLSILTVLHKISPSLWFRVSVYAVAVMLVGYTITFTVLLSGPCNPVDAGNSVCLNNLAIAQVALNIFTDLSIMILPLPTLHKLQIKFRQKVVVGGILCLGSAVLIASIARAPYVKIMATSIDFSRKQAEAGVWSLVELNFGILCNNLMRLKPFLNRYLPKLLTILGLSSGRSKQQPESSTARGDRSNWRRGKPSHSYQLRSLEANEPRRKYENDNDVSDGYGIEGSDKAASRQNGSTESILR
ncbi:hypothetical protein G7Z17_g113 [Cylindrodendrum hubeiense]|uniref:Rhodopsin domain-containing protein n=1 Tax=Cylindrodendrum hubeiense TaxID=595255 RepID=A0A9P5LLH7_9HYPO|nr:hypothetical protein G7Z17_g113 [Cylindrodendrum hubeiense]